MRAILYEANDGEGEENVCAVHARIAVPIWYKTKKERFLAAFAPIVLQPVMLAWVRLSNRSPEMGCRILRCSVNSMIANGNQPMICYEGKQFILSDSIEIASCNNDFSQCCRRWHGNSPAARVRDRNLYH